MASSKKISASIVLGGTITGALKAAFTSTKGSLSDIGKAAADATKRQRLLGDAIQKMGRQTNRDLTGLRAKYAEVTAQVDRLTAAHKRLAAAEERSVKIGNVAGGMKNAGAYAAGVGAMGASVAMLGIRDAIKRENAEVAIRNSGVSKADAEAMIQAAQNSKQFGISITEATHTISELRTALGSVPHAIEALPLALKAKSGLQLYDRLHGTDMAEGDTAYQLAKVADERGGATDPEAMREKYNAAFKALTGSNGKVTIGDLLTSVRAGKGAVQAMSDEAFFGDTFLQQSMGASRYGTASSSLVNAWIGGHQVHSAFDHMMQMGLLDRNHVKFDKTGKVKTIDSNALVDAQMFLKDPQKWVDKYLVPLAKKKGVDTSDPAQVMAFVNSIASNTNAANLLLSRIRFSSNIWKDRNNVMQGNDAEQSDLANQGTAQGRFDNAKSRFNDAVTLFGRALLPTFTTLMDKAASFLSTVTKLMQDHPKLTKAIAVGFTAVAGALVVLGPLLIGIGSALGAYAGYQMLMARFAASAVMSAEGVGLLGGVMGALGAVALPVLGAIVVAALLIWKYWEPISAWVRGFGSGLMQEVLPPLERIGGALGVLWGWFTQLISPVHETKAQLDGAFNSGQAFGRVIGQTLMFGINMFIKLGDAIGTAAGWIAVEFPKAWDALKDKVGAVVDWIMGKLQPLLDAMNYVGTKASQIGNTVGNGAHAVGAKIGAAWDWMTGKDPTASNATASPTMPAMATASGGAAGGPSTVNHNQFNITQQPGESADELADRVARKLDKRQGVAARGSLVDGAQH